MKPIDPTSKKDEELPIFSLIQQLKDESLDPRTLPKELRQQCVEVLLAEGYSESAMAQILKRSEKTIKRDLQEIREKNALSPNLELARQIIGETVQRARMHQGYLVRLARSKDATVSEKAQSEYLAWKVQKELIEKMQSLGYLPSRPQEITGDIYHHMSLQEEEQSFAEIKTMITQIESVARETDTFSDELEREVTLLKAKIEKAEITYEVENLLENQKQIKEGKETQNET
jgi:transposase